MIFSHCQTKAVRLCKAFHKIASSPAVRAGCLFRNWKKHKTDPYWPWKIKEDAYCLIRHAVDHQLEMKHLSRLALEDPAEKRLAFFMAVLLGNFDQFKALFQEIGYCLPFLDRKYTSEEAYDEFNWTFYLIKAPKGTEDRPRRPSDIKDSAADFFSPDFEDRPERRCSDIEDSAAGLATFAAFLGHFDIVKFLWNKGHRDRYTLLGAVCSGNLEMVEFLVENGADHAVYLEADYDELSGLTEFACIYGHLNILKFIKSKNLSSWLKEGEDDFFGFGFDLKTAMWTSTKMWTFTPLFRACEFGHLDIVQYLVSEGADPTSQHDLPIVLAKQGGHQDIVDFLTDCDADCDADQSYDNTMYS